MPYHPYFQDEEGITEGEVLRENMTEARQFSPRILAMSIDVQKIRALSELSIAKAWASIRAAQELLRKSDRGRGA